MRTFCDLHLGRFKVKDHGAKARGRFHVRLPLTPWMVSAVSVTVFEIFDIKAIFPWDASLK